MGLCIIKQLWRFIYVTTLISGSFSENCMLESFQIKEQVVYFYGKNCLKTLSSKLKILNLWVSVKVKKSNQHISSMKRQTKNNGFKVEMVSYLITRQIEQATDFTNFKNPAEQAKIYSPSPHISRKTLWKYEFQTPSEN